MDKIGVKIQYFGLLRNIAGRDEEQIYVPLGASTTDVFQVLIGKYGEEFSSIMLRADGSLRPSAMVVVNGKDIRDSEGLQTRIEGNQEIFLAIGIYPVAGG